MYNFIIYSRKSRTAQDGHTQHTHETSEWHINNYLKHLNEMGVEYTIVESHEEDVSGGGYYTKRPIFNRIVHKCMEDKTLTLLVAKADRMTRNMRTGAELMETINFVLANAPDADNMQKHLEFMIAEREYNNTSQRFKDMYQAKKARCEKEGLPLNWGAGSVKYQEKLARGEVKHVGKKRAILLETYLQSIRDDFEHVVTLMKDGELKNNRPTLKNIANNLEQFNVKARTGKWTPNKVGRALEVLEISRI